MYQVIIKSTKITWTGRRKTKVVESIVTPSMGEAELLVQQYENRPGYVTIWKDLTNYLGSPMATRKLRKPKQYDIDGTVIDDDFDIEAHNSADAKKESAELMREYEQGLRDAPF